MHYKSNTAKLYKKLFFLFLVLVFMAGWYFFVKSTNVISSNPPTPNISSEITNIEAISTNPTTGEMQYHLSADKLTQDQFGMDVLHNVLMNWTPDNEHYTLTAPLATLDEQTGEFVFAEGFGYTHHFADPIQDLIVKGGKLTGNTKTKRLSSSSPLTINQGGHSINAQAMSADLTRQDYEFYDIDMTFLPAKRTDAPLF